MHTNIFFVILFVGFSACSNSGASHTNSQTNQTNNRTQTNNSNHTQNRTQNNTNQNTTLTPRVVKEVEPNGYAEGSTPTPFEWGQSIGGGIEEGSGKKADLDRFSVALEAGSVLLFSIEEMGKGFDEGLSIIIHDENEENIWEHLSSRDGLQRQFFAPTSGRYSLLISDARDQGNHGGATSTYIIKTQRLSVIPEKVELQSDQSNDLGKGIVIYEVVGKGEVVASETIAKRDPIKSELDTKLWLFSPKSKELLAKNDDIDFGKKVVDSRLSFYAADGVTYWIIVDAFELGKDSRYTLHTSIIDDSEFSPIPLSPNSTFTNNIAEVIGSKFDSDFYELVLKPGSGIRIVVEGDDALLPRITGTIITALGNIKLVEGRNEKGKAIVELVHSSAASQVGRYIFRVDDFRNIIKDDQGKTQDLGGAQYGYTIKALPQSWSLKKEEHPASFDVAQGDTYMAEYNLAPTTFVGLEFSADNVSPAIAFLNEGGNASQFENGTALVSTSTKATHIIGIRETYFRSAKIESLVRKTDLSTISFSKINESEPNDAIGDAQKVSLPVAIMGVADGAGKDAINFDYFQVDLVKGDLLSVFVSPGEAGDIADTKIQLLDASAKVLLENDDYPGQSESFFSALFTKIEKDGTYLLRVQPFCPKADTCGGKGNYRLNIFLSSN